MGSQARRSAGRQGQRQDRALPSAADAEDSDGAEAGTHAPASVSAEPTSDTHTSRRSRRAAAASSSAASSAAGKAAVRRANRQQREEEARLRTRRILTEILDRAKFEAYVDPYRGIYAGADRGGCGFATASASGTCDEELARSLAATDFSSLRNPWGGCFGVLLGGACNFSLEEDRATPEGSAVEHTAPTGVGWVPRCSCPSVTSWYDEEVEKKRSKLEKERAINAKKKGRGKGKAKSKEMAAEAETEVQAAETDAQVIGSMDVLTVRRNPDTSCRCLCDYNPLCLASLGGALDDLWKRSIEARRRKQVNVLRSNEDSELLGNGVANNLARRRRWLDDNSGDGGVLGNIARMDTGSKVAYVEAFAEGNVATSTTTNDAAEANDTDRTATVADADMDVDPAINFDATDESAAASSDGEEISDLPMQVRRSVTVDADMVRSYLGKFVVSCLVRGRRKNDSGQPSACWAQISEDTGTISVEGCMDLLRLWHRSLVFPPPSISSNESRTPMVLSAPPGMRNLGATCYLNSQFQCLATNPAFLRGVFSWRIPASSHASSEQSGGGNGSNRMARILSKMQHVLARMTFGPSAVVCTDDFATALGLENNEMQDPNEFARLLFDRMHESFQLMSQTQNNSEGKDGRWQQLLPSIFRGKYAYETRCQHCLNSSIRRENFTDLTLPLVPPDSRVGRDGTSTAPVILDPRDTTLQACLDTYLCPESLDGDNMYHCNSCDAKRDAQRSVSFEQLPPVLNVQVARYVFDKRTLMKKKLMDRVLLPRVLRVPKRRGDNSAQNSEGSESRRRNRGTSKKNSSDSGANSADVDAGLDALEYILCAVQNHRGTSAYGGHYVAETMDWGSGTWFEHNDEEVTLLDGGPHCSYDPDVLTANAAGSTHGVQKRGVRGEGKKLILKDQPAKKPPAPLRGSSDAYSMFFVERDFLAENAFAQMKFNATYAETVATEGVKMEEENDVVAKVTRERLSSYRLMSEVRSQKLRLRRQLRRRRESILTHMFPLSTRGPALSLASTLDSRIMVDSNARLDLVWVDGDLLRRFLSCEDSLDDQLRQVKPGHGGRALLSHRRLLCEHGHLHPRVARKGKLLPREVYDGYTELLLQEWRALQGGSDSDETPELNDCIITPQSNLYCDECARVYQQEVTRKIDALELMVQVYDALEGSENDLDPSKLASFKSGSEGESIYGVSRSFCGKFRRYASHKIKQATSDAPSVTKKTRRDAGENSADAGAASSQSLQVVLHEGLDVLDLGEFPKCSAENLASARAEVVGTDSSDGSGDEDETFDPQINNKIACHHSLSTFMNNRRVVRYVQVDVWKKLTELFPGAITLQRKSGLLGDDKNLPSGNCRQCQLDKDKKNEMTERLISWGERTASNDFCVVDSSGFVLYPQLRQLMEWPEEETVLDLGKLAKQQCYLVHRLDVDSWRTAVDLIKALKSPSAKKSSKGDLAEIQHKIEKLLFHKHRARSKGMQEGSRTRVRSLLCPRHGLTSLAWDSVLRLTEKKCSMEDGVAYLLTRAEYAGFVASLLELEEILFARERKTDLEKEAETAESDKALFKLPEPLPFVDLHPVVSVLEEADIIYEQLEVCPKRCQDDSCIAAFAESCLLPEEGAGVAVSKKKSSKPHGNEGVGKTDCGRRKKRVSNTELSNQNQNKDDILVRCLICEPHVDTAAAMALILPVVKQQNNDNNSNATRRSSRKRKTRSDGASGLRTHDINMCGEDNIAKLRLLLFQEHNKTPLHQNLQLVRTEPADAGISLIDVPWKWNDRVITELGELVGGKPGGGETTFHLLLCYDGNLKRTRLSKEEREARQREEDEMIAALSELACPQGNYEGTFSPTSASKESRGQRKEHLRRRREERGFRGTFLQSISSVSDNGNEPGSASSAGGNIEMQQPITRVDETQISCGGSGGDVICVDIEDDSQSQQEESGKDEVPALSPVDSRCAVERETEPTTVASQGRCSNQLGATDQGVVENEQSIDLTGGNSDSEVSESSADSISQKEYQSASQLPASKWDLSLSTLSRTKPLYYYDKDPANEQYPLKNRQGRKLESPLEILTRKEVTQFVNNAKNSYCNSSTISPSAEDLYKLLPGDYVPEDQARHLFRNFIDSPDTPGGPPGKHPDRLYVSRRELDIMLYFSSVGGSWNDCYSLMPYRKEDSFAQLFNEVKGCKYHARKDPYMEHVKSSVQRLLYMENCGQDVVPKSAPARRNSTSEDDPDRSSGSAHRNDELNHPGAEFLEGPQINSELNSDDEENASGEDQSEGSDSADSNNEAIADIVTDQLVDFIKEENIKPIPSRRQCHTTVVDTMKNADNVQPQIILDSAITTILTDRS